MELHEITAIAASGEPDAYIASVEITDSEGARYQTEYVSRPDDPFGLAPAIREAVEGWIADGKPVAPYEPPPPPTPEEIRAAMSPLTARQLRLGLIGGGFSLSQVAEAIDAIPDPQQKAVAEIEWQYAAQFERLHPLIEQVSGALGLSQEQIDAMWEQALYL